MPINNNPFPQRFTATNGQTVFAYNFTALNAADVIVFKRAAAAAPNDITQKLSYPNQYTVTPALDFNGGVVTLLAGATALDRVTVSLGMPNVRISDYSSTSGFTPAQVNVDFNRDVLMARQNTFIGQTTGPHYNISDNLINPARDVLLPRLANPLSSWRMNAAGTAIENFQPLALEELPMVMRSGLLSGERRDNVEFLHVPVATAKDIETGVSQNHAVTPKALNSHRGLVRAWLVGARYNSCNLYFLWDSYGIKDVTWMGVGRYHVEFAKPFHNLGYSLSGSCCDEEITDMCNPTQSGIVQIIPQSKKLNSCEFFTMTRNFSYKDFAVNDVQFIGRTTTDEVYNG